MWEETDSEGDCTKLCDDDESCTKWSFSDGRCTMIRDLDLDLEWTDKSKAKFTKIDQSFCMVGIPCLPTFVTPVTRHLASGTWHVTVVTSLLGIL